MVKERNFEVISGKCNIVTFCASITRSSDYSNNNSAPKRTVEIDKRC
jgi:hypothetical protein